MEQTEKLKDIVAQGLKDYYEATTADQYARALTIDDGNFVFDEDGQWGKLETERRRGKPRYTINLIAAAVNEVNGNYRQNQIEMKALPEQDQSKAEAKTYNGLMRGILSGQNAEVAKDTLFKGITVGGFGAVRVLNQFTDNNPFEQDIEIEPIYDAAETVWFDPKAKHMTGKDGRFVFEEASLTRDSFIERWPNASLTTWPDADVNNMQSDWGMGGTTSDIRVASYYVKERIKVSKTLLSDGSIMLTDDYKEVVEELAEKQVTLVEAKEVDTFKVMHYKMSGTEVLEEPAEVPTTRLPIVRCLGFHEWRNNSLHYRGIVRNAKDPQRVYNYATSANIEAYALAPKQKVMATKKMIAGHEKTWRALNTSDSPVLTYTPDSSAPDGKPIPFHAVGGSPELVQQAQQAQLDVQQTIGRRAPAQNESAADRSGRAILALQRQDDAVTFELLDNLAMTWTHVAEIVMDMIPVVIDTERQFMILNDDGETEVVTLNQMEKDEQTGKEYRKHDTSRRYRIKATVGPAFETKRSEQVNVLTALMQDPEMKPIVADLFAKNMDAPFADELTTRIRKSQLKAGIVEPNKEEIEEMQAAAQTPEAQKQKQIEEMREAIQLKSEQLTLQRQELENENLSANIGNLNAAALEKANSAIKDKADVSETYTDVYTKQVDTAIKQIEAGIQPTPEQLESIQQSLQLLTATQRDDFNQRLQDAMAQSQQLQPQS
jgi:hypothetical protein